MTRDEWRRVKRLAGDAREMPAGARRAFLDASCAEDEGLRRAVDALLASMAAAESLYETPRVSVAGIPAVLDAPPAVAVAPGAAIGPYRVVREIGRGGMGSVFLACRADGVFDQQVAIKFLSNMASQDSLERFSIERRILATLDHPNIARLFDGGTAHGAPFLTMEYVDGLPIDRFCDDRGVGLTGRLALFRQVCAAVHYAHQRLIVHRDIKASNILVSEDGAPKLLDFGIAKILGPADAPAGTTMFRLLTPESASPEQVRGEPITVAADIYALGVLLYYLISGQRPYGSAARSQSELFHAICEEMPVAPLVARARAGRPPWPAGPFARDLDLIVLKALRKEPERRYSSVEQLSEDVERFLHRKPVLAAPDSRLYRARTLLARHRIAAAAALVAVLAVLSGAAIAAQQAAVARRERLRAEQRFNDVRQMANALVFELHDAIADLPGSLAARQALVNRAVDYLDRLAREAGGAEWALLRELAAANVRLGDIMGGGGISNLGDVDGAERRYLVALGIFERLLAHDPPDAGDVEGLARLHIQISRLSVLKGNLAGADASARAAVTLLDGGPEGPAPAAATAYHQLGFVQARRGQDGAALDSLAEATRRARQLLEAAPDEAAAGARLARIASDYGHQLRLAGRFAESLAVLGEARGHLERLMARDPLNTRHRLTLAHVLNALSMAHRAEGDLQAASGVMGTAMRVLDGLKAESPTDQEIQLTAMITRYWYGTSLIRAGDAAAGVRTLRQAIAEGDDLVGRSPHNAVAANQLAAARVELGVQLLQGDAASRDGCDTLGRGLQGWRELEARGQLPGDSASNRAMFERQWQACAR